MMTNPDIPANKKVLAYLKKRARRDAELVSPPGDPKKDYLGSGAHPDIVERLWKNLNQALPTDSRRLVYGTPALMNPDTGEILAVAIGTSYAIRLPARLAGQKRPEGTSNVITWFGGTKLDLASDFGEDWVVGKWSQDETKWILGSE